jgi:hypothetical protein
MSPASPSGFLAVRNFRQKCQAAAFVWLPANCENRLLGPEFSAFRVFTVDRKNALSMIAALMQA